MSLTEANKARLKKALNQVYKFPEGLFLLKDYIEKYAIAKQKTVENKVKYNRIKWNRMSGSEQAGYVKRMNKKKNVYHITKEDESMIVIPKIVFDSLDLKELPVKNLYRKHKAPTNYIL